MSPRARRVLLIASVGTVAWYLCVVFLWAVQPLHDTVPVGIDATNEFKAISQEVECNTLFDAAARDRSPLPTLKDQPPPYAALAYQRPACGAVQRDARVMFGLATVFAAGSLGGLTLVARRVRIHPSDRIAIT